MISGTRVPLRTVLACVAAGDDVATIVREFPSLREDDVRAASEFARSDPFAFLTGPAEDICSPSDGEPLGDED